MACSLFVALPPTRCLLLLGEAPNGLFLVTEDMSLWVPTQDMAQPQDFLDCFD